MIAAVRDTPYNIVLLLHILTAMVAFAPAFVHSFLTAQSEGMGEARQSLFGYMAGNSRRVYAPALIINGVLGFGLSGMSGGFYPLSQTWLLAAIIVWLAMNGVLHAVVIPAEKAMAEGIESAKSKLDMGGAILSISMLLMLFLMVFKPGQ